MNTLDRIGRRQYGLATARQLRAAGWSTWQVQYAVRAGRLIPVRPGVYRASGVAPSWEQAVMAAILAAADGTLASHLTGCRLWGLFAFPAPAGIDVLVAGGKAPRLPGVIGHRTNLLPESHRTIHRRIPVTTAERTLVDCCGLVTPAQLRLAANDAQRRGILRLPRLARTVDEVPVSGRRPIVPMVELLKVLIPGYDAGDSDPEVDLVELLTSAGFPRPQQQIRVQTDTGVKFLDVGWIETRTAFEYDSLEFHEHRFHEDRDRLRALKRAGWDVWPITSTTSRNEILAIATLAFEHPRAA